MHYSKQTSKDNMWLCVYFSGIISNRGNSKHLTRPIEQIDVEEDDDDEEDEDDEDEEEDIFTGCSINRPVTGILTVKIALLTFNWFD